MDWTDYRFGLDGRHIQVFREPVYHIVIDSLFGSEMNREILDHAISLEEHFEDATILEDQVSVNPAWRSNRVCYPDQLFFDPKGPTDRESRIRYRAERSPLLAAFDSLMLSKVFHEIMDTTPHPLCKLRETNRWETQLSRYGDQAQHYRWHLDRSEGDQRLVSIVYHFHQNPRPFSGGELVLTNALMTNGELVSEGETKSYEVENDRAILFPSRTVHSVRPTFSPEEFSQGRFSVNLWAGRDGSFEGTNLF